MTNWAIDRPLRNTINGYTEGDPTCLLHENTRWGGLSVMNNVCYKDKMESLQWDVYKYMPIVFHMVLYKKNTINMKTTTKMDSQLATCTTLVHLVGLSCTVITNSLYIYKIVNRCYVRHFLICWIIISYGFI